MAAEGTSTASLKLTGFAPTVKVTGDDSPSIVAARVRTQAISDINTAINRFEELQIDEATAWEIYIIQYAVIPQLRQARLSLRLRPSAPSPLAGDEMAELEEACAALEEARVALEGAMHVLRKKSMLQFAVHSTFNAAIAALVTAIVQIPRS